MTATHHDTPAVGVRAHLALIAVALATLVLSIDSATVNVALPHIREDFAAGSSVTWVVTAYLLGALVSISMSGWVTARWGIKGPMLVAIGAFVVGSAIAAAAPGLPTLIAARALVGLVGAPLIPLSMTLVLRIYPLERRGWAMSMWAIAGLLGPSVGPAIGGRVTDVWSWRWLFLGVPPLALAALVFAWIVVPDIDGGNDDDDRRLDVTGLLIGAPALCLAVLGLSRGQRWGWTAPLTVACLGIGLPGLVLFVRRALRVSRPLVDLTLLRVPLVTLGCAMTAAATACLQARLVFVPLALADERGWSTTRIGLLYLPPAVATALGLVITGRLVDRRGPRESLIVGAGCILAGTLAIVAWGKDTSTAWILGSMAVHGLGQGLFMGPSAVIALAHVDARRTARASTLRQLLHQLGGVLSSALLGSALVALRDGRDQIGDIQRAYDVVFLAAAAVALAMLLLSTRVPAGPLQARPAASRTLPDG